MPDDSTKSGRPMGTDTRLLNLTERWATETTRIAEYFRQMKDLMKDMTETIESLGSKVTELDLKCLAFATQVSELKSQCQKAQRKAGFVGVLDWGVKTAMDQPLAFSLVFVTLVMMLVLITILGYRLNLPAIVNPG